jgi:hypothetical protein
MATGTIVGATLVVGRWVAPPPASAASAVLAPARSDGRPPAVADVASPSSLSSSSSSATTPWFTLHVLYASCRCSENIFAHLFQRGPITGATERIVLVTAHGDDPTAAGYHARATAAGFRVETVTPDDLARRFGVEAAPLLVVADPTGRVRYAGGYTDRKQHLELGDQTIIADLMAGRPSTELSLVASAVSRRLQDALDLPRRPGGPTGE